MSTTDQSPAVETPQFRMTIFFVCAVQVLAVIYEIWQGTPFTLAVAVLLLIATVGLFRKVRWGRRMSTAFLWLLMGVAIGLILPARMEGDMAMGVESPTMLVAAAQFIVLCGVAIVSLHFLGKYKSLFRPDWF